jgi:hypothetical protein
MISSSVAAVAAINEGKTIDLLNANLPGALALDRPSNAEAQQLLMRTYTRRTMDRYKRVGERLADFADSHGSVNE